MTREAKLAALALAMFPMFAMLATLAACRNEPSKQPAAEPAPTVEPAAAAASDVAPTWLVHIPDTPGMPVLERTEGPVLAGELVLVASSAIGFAAVDRATGRLRWQRRGEEQPQRPIVRDDVVLLAGRCGAAIEEAPADVAIAGCVEEVTLATGEFVRRSWVLAPGAVRRPMVVAEWGEQLIWAASGVVWLDVGSFDNGNGTPQVLARHGDNEELVAVIPHGSRAIVIWRDEVEVLERHAGGFRRAASRRLGSSVLRGVSHARVDDDVIAVVLDDVLEGWRVDTLAVAWRAPSRMSFGPGTLAQRNGLRGIALTGGVHVVSVDADGVLQQEGERRPGLQAMSARFDEAGAAMVAVRPTTSLLRDQVMYFDAEGAHRWTWEVPAPTAARLDPVGVDGDADGVFVFYDGREVARLTP